MKKTLTTLALTVVVLLGMGIVLLATASTVRAQGLYADPHYFFKRQLMWLGLSVAVAFFACRFDYHYWRKYPLLSIILVAAVVVGLLLVFCPGIGGRVKGSCRWINLGFSRIQPSEFAKIATEIGRASCRERV